MPEETPEKDPAQTEGSEQQEKGQEPSEGREPEKKDETDLDLDRAKEKINKANREAENLRKRLKKFEDANKSEQEKLAEKVTEAEGRASTAEATALRLDVALDKAPEGMSLAQVRKLAKRLTGADREELEADAEELFADFAPGGGDDEGKGSGRRPKERLRPGAAPSSEPEETDPKKLADSVPRMY